MSTKAQPETNTQSTHPEESKFPINLVRQVPDKKGGPQPRYRLEEFIIANEGKEKTVYLDSENIPTLGVGYALLIRDRTDTYVIREGLETDFRKAGILAKDNAAQEEPDPSVLFGLPCLLTARIRW